MNFPILRHLTLFICIASLLYIPLSAETWNLIGLRDQQVNCLLAKDSTLIFAGTGDGISVHWTMGQERGWTKAYSGLPVNAIARINSSTVIAAAGMGTFSDGLYIGRDVLDGPPFYAFSIGLFCYRPTALALKDTIIEGNTMTLVYTGSGNSISVGRFIKDSLHALADIPMPQNAFGVEMPHCAALHVFAMNRTLYAGGYDRSPEPGPGSFLELVSDSFHIIRRVNVTAMTEGSFLPEVSRPELLIGTSDSGVFRFTPSPAEWINLGSPVAGQPIQSVCALPRSLLPMDFPIAAVDSGIFSGSGTGNQTSWVETGDIPAKPLCVVVSPFMRGTQATLMAGTDSGVYEFGPEARARNRLIPAHAVPALVRFNGTCLIIALPAAITLPVRLNIFTMDGRRIKHSVLRSYNAAVRFQSNNKGVFIASIYDKSRKIVALKKISAAAQN